jgi:hypothetical protein
MQSVCYTKPEIWYYSKEHPEIPPDFLRNAILDHQSIDNWTKHNSTLDDRQRTFTCNRAVLVSVAKPPKSRHAVPTTIRRCSVKGAASSALLSATSIKSLHFLGNFGWHRKCSINQMPAVVQCATFSPNPRGSLCEAELANRVGLNSLEFTTARPITQQSCTPRTNSLALSCS